MWRALSQKRYLKAVETLDVSGGALDFLIAIYLKDVLVNVNALQRQRRDRPRNYSSKFVDLNFGPLAAGVCAPIMRVVSFNHPLEQPGTKCPESIMSTCTGSD